MEQSKGMRLGALLAMMYIVSMAFVSAVTGTLERSMEEWTKDHTVNVELTTIYRYD